MPVMLTKLSSIADVKTYLPLTYRDQRPVAAGKRRMLALVRACEPSSLATLVPVRLKLCVRRPAHERDFLAHMLVQWQHVESIDESSDATIPRCAYR